MRKQRSRSRSRPGVLLGNMHKPLRMGPPRIVEDKELYEMVAYGAAHHVSAADIAKDVRTWCTPWEDWQLMTIALRAQLFLACVRKEVGRRKGMDPNQLRLMEGV